MADIESWVAENYDAVVADESRNETYETIAATADVLGAPELAAWARKRAADAGKNVTPKAARAEEKSVRSEK